MEVEEVKVKEAPRRGSKKKDVALSKAEEARLMAALETEKEKILNTREDAEEAKADLQERWADRYQCIVRPANRKGVKGLAMYVEHPSRGVNKPYRLEIACNKLIEDGLPMFVIQRIQRMHDSEADDSDELPSGSAGNNHTVRRQPRFTVEIKKKVANPKVYK